MKKIVACLYIGLALFPGMILAADPTPTVPKKTYSYPEYINMTYCVGLADTFFSVASQKASGVSKEEMQKYYSSKSSSDENMQIQLATVDKVYSSTTSSPWELASSFFGECAFKLANVPVERLKTASFCNRNTYIGDVAYSYKAAGKPKEEVYKSLANLDSGALHTIVDQVYNGSLSRAALKMNLWNSCMDPVSDNRMPTNP